MDFWFVDGVWLARCGRVGWSVERLCAVVPNVVHKLIRQVVRLRCPGCGRVFCLDCDMYVHESLHNCPGCG